jgi:preprotein translocase subunit SecB
MSSPALRLEGYFYERLAVEANPAWPAGKPPAMGVRVNVEVGQRKDERTRWRIVMDVHGQTDREGEPIAYAIDLRCQGFFVVETSQGEEGKARELVQVTGASMLYSAARDMVLTLSSRSQFGPVVLPTISFLKPGTPRPPEARRQSIPARKGSAQVVPAARAKRRATR